MILLTWTLLQTHKSRTNPSNGNSRAHEHQHGRGHGHGRDRGRGREYVGVGPDGFQCRVNQSQLTRLALLAFQQVLRRRQTLFQPVLLWLDHQL